MIFSGTLVGSTTEVGEPSVQGQDRSVWYKWTPSKSGEVLFDVLDPPNHGDASINVCFFTGNAVGSLTQVTQEMTFSGPSRENRLLVEVTAGVEYKIMVSNQSSKPPVPFTIFFTQYSTPVNDNFANAILLSSTLGDLNTLRDTYQGNNHGSSKQTGEPNHAAGFLGVSNGSVWYKFISPVKGKIGIYVSVCSDPALTFGSLGLAVYRGNSVDALTLVTRNAASSGTGAQVTWDANVGDTFYIAFAAVNGTPPSYSDFTFSVTAGAVPENDLFENAIDLGDVNFTILRGTTIASSIDYFGTPDDDNMTDGIHDVWYRWVAPKNGTLTLTANCPVHIGLDIFAGAGWGLDILDELTTFGGQGAQGTGIVINQKTVIAGRQYYFKVSSGHYEQANDSHGADFTLSLTV